jgi:hypothetical protein
MCLWDSGVLHYHESWCHEKFHLDQPLEAGENCPKCGHPFLLQAEMNCHGCDTVYYTDVDHEVGDKFLCPIHGESVEVIDSKSTGPTRTSENNGEKANGFPVKVILLAIAATAIICGVPIFGNWVTSLVAATVAGITSAISAFIGWIISIFTLALFFLAQGAIGIAILITIYLILYLLAARPTHSFAAIYQDAQKNRNLDTLGKTADKGRDTILRQQAIIGLLIIALAMVVLNCYLSIKTTQRAVEVFQSAVLLGTANLIGFAIIFYASKFLFRLDNLWASKRFLRGVMLSLMFGAATVSTLVILPTVLGEYLLPGSEIAIELTLNVIADVLISFYETIANLFWKTSRGTFQTLRKLSTWFG